MVTGSFSGEEQPGRGVDHPVHPAPKLKKELCFNSISHLGLSDLETTENATRLLLKRA